MRTKIETILNEVLPEKCYRKVWNTKTFYGTPQIGIAFSISDYDINNVRNQKIQIVSLILDLNEMELTPQCFGGCGGQSIYRKPNLELRDEKYLAMKSIKIPFRKPKGEEKFILAAIKRFAENWLKALKENREVLMYQEYVNYDEII